MNVNISSKNNKLPEQKITALQNENNIGDGKISASDASLIKTIMED